MRNMDARMPELFRLPKPAEARKLSLAEMSFSAGNARLAQWQSITFTQLLRN